MTTIDDILNSPIISDTGDLIPIYDVIPSIDANVYWQTGLKIEYNNVFYEITIGGYNGEARLKQLSSR